MPRKIPIYTKVGGSNRHPHSIRLAQAAETVVDDRDYPIDSVHTWLHYKPKHVRTARAGRRINRGEHRVHLFLHREIYERYHGPIPPGFEIDHKNRDGLDNRLDNLRLVPSDGSEQAINKELRADSKSGYKGVSPVKEGWKVQVMFRKQRRYYAIYSTREEAAFAYDLVASLLHGSDAILNNPDLSRISVERQQSIRDRVREKFREVD